MKKYLSYTNTLKNSIFKNFKSFSIERQIKIEKNTSIDSVLKHKNFTSRHIGPCDFETKEMLNFVNSQSLEHVIKQTVPDNILLKKESVEDQVKTLGEPLSEFTALKGLKEIAKHNIINKNYIGCGYNPVITPPVILRNVLENPAWYTSYTPYQAEISQGRLESLLNYQTMICELTGLPFSNASLLDEATSAAEAMYLAYNASNGKKKTFLVSEHLFPFIKDTIRSRAYYLGINIEEGFSNISNDVFGVIVQNPDNNGKVIDYTNFTKEMKDKGIVTIVAADILSLLICKSPGEMGFDIAVGSAQRFGVPMMNGGPHAGFFAVKDEFKRKVPGRVVGVSKDRHGNPALRLALQTREQHIRRDKATSNICTAQALLANMAAFYAIFHSKQGLINISRRINLYAATLGRTLSENGYKLLNNVEEIFDTVAINLSGSGLKLNDLKIFEQNGINIRIINDNSCSVTLNETTDLSELEQLLNIFLNLKKKQSHKIEDLKFNTELNSSLRRGSNEFMKQDIFNKFSSETEVLRYIYRLQLKDISLCNSMISLGSCTMKMNATSELIPVTWPEFTEIHPFSNPEQMKGYKLMIEELIDMLRSITTFDSVSLQPNSGANGEYAGLIAIRRYQESQKQGHRNICLIPSSAHGTNPASAAIAGMKVVVVSCDNQGNINTDDLKKKAEENKDSLSALMVTYPSTHGVFEESIIEVCDIIHKYGGQVYMDGANMNAQVLITSPSTVGADVCHLNLHKTFCIPHGGGGPGVGPICVKKHLTPFLPGHYELDRTSNMNWSLTSAPYGSAGILPIPYMYIKMLGMDLLKATQVAILNANYMMERLKNSYKILYVGSKGRVAHEFIIDIRDIKKQTGITEEDVAKRLIDYGFHAPTMSFPVPGTLMVEPTESEDKGELDRFCDALLNIRKEIKEVEDGISDKLDNVLKNAPHTQEHVTANEWTHPYGREKAAYPLPYVRARGKFWPSVGRVDNVYGDLNLVCTCPDINSYTD